MDTTIKALYHNDPRRPIDYPAAADLEKIDINRVLETYKNEFSNADGFHFFIVGNVDKKTIKPLLEKYLASLPAKGTMPTFKDNGLRPISGNITVSFKNGQEQKSLILSYYKGELPFTEELILQTYIVGELLTIKVLEEIREEMGAMYSGGFYGNFEKDPYPHFTISAYFPCGPENVEAVIAKANEEIADIKANGPTGKNLNKVKLTQIEKRKALLKTNDYWSSKLSAILFWNYDKNRFLDMNNQISKLTVADLQKTANALFTGKNNFTAILYPAVTEEAKVPEPAQQN